MAKWWQLLQAVGMRCAALADSGIVAAIR